jgi:acyl-CoA synthetase (AMP-forming)/AMP-acid ligase II
VRDYPLGDYLTRARATAPGRLAVVSVPERRTLTYAQLDEVTDRVANALLGLGLRRGDRLACWLRTGTAYLELYLGAAKAGVAIVPVNERFRATEAAYVLADCEARLLAADTAFAGEVEQLGLDAAVRVVEVGGNEIPGALPYERLREGAIGRPAAPGVDDVMLLGYTSGTTGFPKGARITHRGLLNINRSNALVYRLPMASVGLYTGSMSFTATVPAFILTHLFLAGTVVLSGTRDPETVTAQVAEHGATYLSVPPPMVDEYAAAFRAHPDRLRTVVSVLQGAGKVPADQLVGLNESLSGRLVLGWGMTENSGGLATATSARDHARALAGEPELMETVGTAVPGAAVRAVGPDGAELPRDGSSVGELTIESPALMAGYWRDEAATARALRDGWYHSGDLGTIDPDGYVRIVDRRDDLIVSGGMNVYPSEVERVLRALPGVADVAVVGMPHERWGQAVVAAIVPNGGSLGPDDVIAYCRSTLAGFKKPVRVLMVPELPRTVAGKVARPEVRKLFEGTG